MRRPAIAVVVTACFLFSAIASLAMERQSNSVYRARRVALSNKTNGAGVLLFAPTEAEGPNAVYGFRQEDNFYYLTGLLEPGAGLLILPALDSKGDQQARPYTEILFLPARNIVQEKWTGPKMDAKTANAKERTGFDSVMPLDAARDELASRLSLRPTVYSDISHTSGSAGPIEWLRRANAFPLGTQFQDVKPILGNQRITKDAGEVDLIRKATDASIAGHLAAWKMIKPGISENSVSAVMQYEYQRNGCERPAYAPIVGSGFNSTVLHYSQNSKTIEDGDVIVMDVAGEYSMYASDITRTVPANGKFTARQHEIYDIVLGAHDAAVHAFKSGVSTIRTGSPNSLNDVAMEYINTHGKDLHGQKLGQYFIHGLGHYVGLSVHDPGDNLPLAPGAVFTIEPGIYIPEEKLGVRIEDTFWVNDKGELVSLSGAIPTKADDIEKAMAHK